MKYKIKYCKPNLVQRFLYWTGILKDPRYNGKKLDRCLHDEAGLWQTQNYEGINLKNRFANDESLAGNLASLNQEERAELYNQAKSGMRGVYPNKKAPN